MTRIKKILSVMLVGVLLSVVPATAQMHQDQKGEKDPSGMAEKCQAMMHKHKAMQEEMARTADRLKELQNRMNAAAGDEKTEAMAEIVNTLVNQHLAMQEKMTTMMPEMMRHMTDHMASGMMKGMRESMEGCMMMKGMMEQGSGEGKTENAGHAGQH